MPVGFARAGLSVGLCHAAIWFGGLAVVKGVHAAKGWHASPVAKSPLGCQAAVGAIHTIALGLSVDEVPVTEREPLSATTARANNRI